MLNYANSVSCSTSGSKNEFILTFRQIHPVIAADGTSNTNAEEMVAEIVMNHEMAAALKTILEGALSAGPMVE